MIQARRQITWSLVWLGLGGLMALLVPMPIPPPVLVLLALGQIFLYFSFRQEEKTVNKKAQEQEREQFVRWLINEGVESSVLSQDLRIDDVLLLPRENIDYWEVCRIDIDRNLVEVFLLPALDRFDPDRYRRVERFRSDEPVTKLVPQNIDSQKWVKQNAENN
jgi:hypothetical protein